MATATGVATVEPRAATTNPARATGLAGLASFVLIVVGIFVSPPLWDTPGTRAPAADVVRYTHDHAGRIIASLLVYSVAMGLFLWFVAGLWAWLREREPGAEGLCAAFAFGGVALTVLIVAAFVPLYMLSYRQQPAVMSGMSDLAFGLLALSGIPTAVCLSAYAGLVARGRPLPVWTAWLAICAAAAHVVIAGSFVSHGAFLSLEGSVIVWVPATFFAWIFATSAALLRAR
jgi:hypothetical protein